MLLSACLIAVAYLSICATANTEKVIFTAPDSIEFGDARPNLLDLGLDTFTPVKLASRATLPVAFPTDQDPRGVQSWYLLQALTQGQRYEVRVCWAATQPTQFWLETYNITHVLNSPSLIQDLAFFAEGYKDGISSEPPDSPLPQLSTSQSALFLRVWAAADYYTSDQQLMKLPLPVDVNIILDPYLFNIFPQSLVPTAAYIILIALGGIYLSGSAWKAVQRFLNDKEHLD